MYKKGDLVVLVRPDKDNVDERLIGIVLDTAIWPEHNNGEGIVDLYVHWTTGEYFWCCEDAVSFLEN